MSTILKFTESDRTTYLLENHLNPKGGEIARVQMVEGRERPRTTIFGHSWGFRNRVEAEEYIEKAIGYCDFLEV